MQACNLSDLCEPKRLRKSKVGGVFEGRGARLCLCFRSWLRRQGLLTNPRISNRMIWSQDLTGSPVGSPPRLTIDRSGYRGYHSVISPRQSDYMHGCGWGDPTGNQLGLLWCGQEQLAYRRWYLSMTPPENIFLFLNMARARATFTCPGLRMNLQ